MKKITMLTVLTILVAGHSIFAQTSAPFKVDVRKFDEEYAAEGKSSVNEKVLHNFNRMFSDVSNVKWTKDGKYDRVYFQRKGRTTRAAFNSKGQFIYSITTYQEENLPNDILLMVKQAYYGKNIFGVTEVSALGKTAYLIILEDKTSWLHIKVLDGEIFEEQILLKSN